MNRLEYLIRKNQGRMVMAEYKENLSRIFQIEFQDNDFIDLEESDIIIAEYYNAYRSSIKSFKKAYYTNNVRDLGEQITRFANVLDNEVGYLITSKSEICGVCKVAIGLALKNYKEIIDLDGDSLCIFSIDKSKGLNIDYFEEYENNIPVSKFELTVWGWRNQSAAL